MLESLRNTRSSGIDFLHAQTDQYVIGLSVLLIALIGALDFFTGSEFSFSVFYLTPIVIASWFVDRRAGIIAALVSVVVWLVVDLAGDRVYSSDVIPFWNALVRGGFFLIVALALSALRAAQTQQEELAQFIVHDLRSPVSNALSGLQFLLEISDDNMDLEQQHVAHLCASSCTRALTLINSLLDLARLDSGKMQLNLDQAIVETLLDASLEQVAAQAERSDVTLSGDVDSGAEVVLADTEITLRILVNLLSNALKYIPKNGAIRVKAVPYADNMIVISIADEGRGIPPEWVNRVFDKFSQVEARKAGIGTGSGLGLSFCRSAVEAQGGRIWLESEMGKGTTVFFTVPRPESVPTSA